MKILVDGGGLVELVDFPYTVQHVNLLLMIQRMIENAPLRARTLTGATVLIPAFRFLAERENLHLLNAS